MSNKKILCKREKKLVNVSDDLHEDNNVKIQKFSLKISIFFSDLIQNASKAAG